LNGATTFVATYQDFKPLAEKLSTKLIIVALSELEDERSRLGLDRVPGTVWQWYLLARALDHWRGALETHDTIVRFRTDLRLFPGFSVSDCIGRADSNGVGIVYAASDIFFYSTTETFLRLFQGSMYDLVASQYMEPEPTKKQIETLKRAIREYGGSEYSCLLGKDYAPTPRFRSLHPDEHATVLVSMGIAAKMERTLLQMAKKMAHSEPLSRRSLLSTQYAKDVWCGCKVGQAWRLGKSGKRFHSESAFSHHLYTNGVSCLPVDFPHREVISVHPNRSMFNFSAERVWT
jgi:hypothetical protein